MSKQKPPVAKKGSLNTATKTIGDNKKARFNYEILSELECGIVLAGTEVKSLRAGRMNFVDSYCEVSADYQLYIYKLNISHYDQGNMFNHKTDRPRKLLAHHDEIVKLYKKVREKGITLVPLRFYFKGNKVKVLLGLARGKKLYDKRETIKERDVKISIAREGKRF